MLPKKKTLKTTKKAAPATPIPAAPNEPARRTEWQRGLALCRPIIEPVESKSDLYNLLFVSRIFRLEAERALYRTVVFRHSSQDHQLLHFIGRIRLGDRVALYVRHLSIGDIHLDSKYLTSFEKALQKMCNLKELILMRCGYTVMSFSGCRFQLHTLVMESLKPSDSTFLETQKELTTLHLGHSDLSFSSDAFPKLVILSAELPGSISFINTSPLRALRFLKCPQIESCIRQQSVRSLRIPFLDSRRPEEFSAIVEAFPSLRYLRIDFVPLHWDTPKTLSTHFVQTMFTLLSNLDSLQKFNIYIEYNPRSHGCMMAENSFAILKNLKVFAFESYGIIWDPRGAIRDSFRMQWVRGVKRYEDYPENDDEWKDSRWC